MPGKRHPLLLAVCCTAQFMVILDVAIVNVALPSIRASLGFRAIDLQWIVNAYTITFAGFLMLGGRAADLFGQRRTFIAGLLLFACASPGCRRRCRSSPPRSPPGPNGCERSACGGR